MCVIAIMPLSSNVNGQVNNLINRRSACRQAVTTHQCHMINLLYCYWAWLQISAALMTHESLMSHETMCTTCMQKCSIGKRPSDLGDSRHERLD